MSFVIYRALGPSGKSYVGLTNSLSKRKYYHGYFARKGSKGHFANALRKFGVDAFKWEVLDRAETRHQAFELEKFHITRLDSFNTGYNSTPGGNHPLNLPGFKLTSEHKAKISKALLGHPGAFAGKQLSTDHRRKLAVAKNGKPFFSIDRRTGQRILWLTKPECMIHFGMKSKGTLWACLAGRKTSYKNQEFRYT